jgi:hypothetical protein
MDELTGTGSAETFTGAFAGAGEYTAWMKDNGTYCATQMTGVHTVNESPQPTGLMLTAMPAEICEGLSSTLTAKASYGVEYCLDGSSWGTSTTFSVKPTSNESYTLYAKTAAGCTDTKTDAAAVTVSPLPGVPTDASANSRCGAGTVTFSATAPGSCTIDWYTAGGSLVSSGTTSFSPSLTYTTNYHAQARNTATGCVSATRLAVTGTIKPVPTIARVATGGDASQTAELRTAAITPIIYTANSSATISRTAGSFPSSVSGTPSGSSFTISGTPSSTGTYGYTLTANANGCTSTAAGTITVILSTTLCTQCCYSNFVWVNCYVTTNALSTGAVWNGYGSSKTYGAMSTKDGRANFAAITASSSNYTAASAIGICKSLGTGWYLPASEELWAMSSNDPSSNSNNLPGAGILTGGTETWHWSSTETTTPGDYYDAMTVRPKGYSVAFGRTNYYYVHCAKLQ